MHGKPITRRDFVAQGLMSGAAFCVAPSLFTSLLSARAAVDEEDLGFKSWTPFMVLDLRGGASLPGNFLVGGKEGPEDLLPKYSELGWNPKGQGYDTRFGIPMAKGDVSQIFAGMTEIMSEEAQKNFRLGSFCHYAADDNPSNEFSALLEIARASERGRFFRSSLGLRTTPFGGNSIGPRVHSKFSPLVVNRAEDLINGVGYAGIANQDLPKFLKKKYANRLRALVREQLRSITRFQSEAVLRKRIEEAFVANTVEVKPETLDPRLDPVFQSVFSINSNSSSSERSVRIATIVKNVLSRNAGPGCVEIAGCDYHDRQPGVADNKDGEIGTELGRIVESAHRMKTPVMVQIVTDGGVGAIEGERIWTGDAGDKSMSLLGYYRPEGAPEMRRTQVGNYTAGQGVDLETPIAKDKVSKRIAYSVLSNYLNVHGKLSLKREFGGAGPEIFELIDRKIIDEVLLFS